MGLVRLKQKGRLNVRQREEVRRALARAGEARGWAGSAAASTDPVAEVCEDVVEVVRDGSRELERELADTVAAKQSEIEELEELATSARELSEAEDETFPVEISYSHTARDVTLGLITNVEMVTVGDAQEAEALAGTIEKNLSRWDKLRAQMLGELEEKQRLLDQLTRERSDFVASLEDLVEDVLVTLG